MIGLICDKITKWSGGFHQLTIHGKMLLFYQRYFDIINKSVNILISWSSIISPVMWELQGVLQEAKNQDVNGRGGDAITKVINKD